MGCRTVVRDPTLPAVPWAHHLACFSRAPLFFFTDTAPTEIYTLSLHDALPILARRGDHVSVAVFCGIGLLHLDEVAVGLGHRRSEEHTSELQSRPHLVCRLLLEKKNASSR